MSGKFPYLFENRPLPEGISTAHNLSSVSKESKMLVMADGDWLINQVSGKDQSAFPLGWDRYTEKQYANKVFLENLVDYFMNDERLIGLRNREVKLRLLDQAVLKESKMKWQMTNVIFPVLFLGIVAFIQQYLRKRKYTS